MLTLCKSLICFYWSSSQTLLWHNKSVRSVCDNDNFTLNSWSRGASLMPKHTHTHTHSCCRHVEDCLWCLMQVLLAFVWLCVWENFMHLHICIPAAEQWIKKTSNICAFFSLNVICILVKTWSNKTTYTALMSFQRTSVIFFFWVLNI